MVRTNRYRYDTDNVGCGPLFSVPELYEILKITLFMIMFRIFNFWYIISTNFLFLISYIRTKTSGVTRVHKLIHLSSSSTLHWSYRFQEWLKLIIPKEANSSKIYILILSCNCQTFLYKKMERKKKRHWQLLVPHPLHSHNFFSFLFSFKMTQSSTTRN